MQNRQLEADFIKGVAIVLMVYGHVTHVGRYALQQSSMVKLIYTFHMPLFLIVSGYFLKPDRAYNVMFKKLCSQIIRPYFFFITCYLVGLMLVAKIGVRTSNVAPSGLGQIILIELYKPIGAYWFLHSLIMLMVAVILGKVLALHLRMKNFWIVAIVILLLFSAIGLVSLRTISYYLFGVVLAYCCKELPRSYIMSGLAIVVIIIFGVPFVWSLKQVVWCFSILTLLSAIAHHFAAQRIMLFLVYLGKNSLIVLLLHAIFLIALKSAGNFFLMVDATGVLYSIMVVFITMFCCLAFAWLLDRSNLSQVLFGTNKIYSSLK